MRLQLHTQKERGQHLELMADILATTLTVPAASATSSPKEATATKQGAEEVLRTSSSAFRETLLAILIVEFPLLGVRENIVGTTGPGAKSERAKE